MQIVFNLGKILCKEATIGADGVSAQWNSARFWNVLANEFKRCCASFFERDGAGLNGFKQTRLGVHVDNDLVHAGKYFV